MREQDPRSESTYQVKPHQYWKDSSSQAHPWCSLCGYQFFHKLDCGYAKDSADAYIPEEENPPAPKKYGFGQQISEPIQRNAWVAIMLTTVSFALWQHSVAAGFFIFGLIMTIAIIFGYFFLENIRLR